MKPIFNRAIALVATFLVCLSLIAIPVARAQQGPGNATFTNKTVTATAAVLVAANSQTSSIHIVNNGSVTAYVGQSSAVTSSTGTPIPANTFIDIVGVTSAIYCITASSTTDLRVTVTQNKGSVTAGRLIATGISNGAANTTFGCSDGTNIIACTPLVYNVTTAITANSTSTATAAGTFAITSHATGRGLLFVSDGSLWQLSGPGSGGVVQTSPVTIATTSTTDAYISMPFAGIVSAIDFNSLDALAASDTNYITWTLTNLGQSHVGTTALLAATAANTTQTTGGTALVALDRRSMTVHGTAGNLVVAKGDVVRCRATVTGTLVGTVTVSRYVFYITRTA